VNCKACSSCDKCVLCKNCEECIACELSNNCKGRASLVCHVGNTGHHVKNTTTATGKRGNEVMAILN
jgi:hypothetical protein